MKILVVGLGSMGKRRVRNLIANGVEPQNIIGYDQRPERVEEASHLYGISRADSINEELVESVEGFVISTSPDQHVPYACMAAKAGKHMFIEASVLADGLQELNDIATRNKVVVFPSCTMRFFAGPRRLRELVQQGAVGNVLAWQYQSGQYLPDWHPWESILDFYVSNPETGGCREIVPFEMVWLSQVFGKVRNVEARKKKMSDMPAEIDDIYMLQMEHENGVLGQLIVDVLGRSPVRDIRITGSKGTIEWNDELKTIRVFSSESGSWSEEQVGLGSVEKQYINPEEPYIQEIATFLACMQKNEAPEYTLEQDIDMLQMLYKAEQSDNDSVRVTI